MKVSTRSWHYNFSLMMYDWEERSDDRRVANFKYRMSQTTKCDYWLRIIGNLLFLSVIVILVLIFVVCIILSGLWIPLLMFIGVMWSIIGCSTLYVNYNSRCDKIELTDQDDEE
jgi:hypothetical protein